jgi:hypothetical protein
LEQNNETNLPEQLAGAVEATKKENRKQHEVWELSFYWKDYRSNEFVWQKLDYMPARQVIQAATTTHVPVNGSLQLMQLNTFIARHDFI